MTALLAANVAQEPWVRWTCLVALALLCVGCLLATARVVRGPSLPDRVVALDLLGTLVAGAIAVYAVMVEEAIFLLASMLLALLLFIGTVAFAAYLRNGARP